MLRITVEIGAGLAVGGREAFLLEVGSGEVQAVGGSGEVQAVGGSGEVQAVGGSGEVRTVVGSGAVRVVGEDLTAESSGKVLAVGGSGEVRAEGREGLEEEVKIGRRGLDGEDSPGRLVDGQGES